VHVCFCIIDASPLHVRCVPLSSDKTGVQHQPLQAMVWHQEEPFVSLADPVCCCCGERLSTCQGKGVLNCSW